MVYMNAKDPTPAQELHSREALAPVFAELNKYDATTHFVGQNTISSASISNSNCTVIEIMKLFSARFTEFLQRIF